MLAGSDSTVTFEEALRFLENNLCEDLPLNKLQEEPYQAQMTATRCHYQHTTAQEHMLGNKFASSSCISDLYE